MPEPDWVSRWQDQVMMDDDLVRFVDDVGFCTINMLDNYPDFPSQEVAMGIPDVLSNTWFWKDDLHIDKRLYYSRVFAGKPGFISFEYLPAFIAANGEVMDELMMYGKLPVASADIYRAIEQQGPISTKNIKALLGPDAKKSSASILIELERRFIITKTGITGRERGTYGYIWDLAERWVPKAFDEAGKLGEKAGRKIIQDRFSMLGVPVDHKFEQRVMRW